MSLWTEEEKRSLLFALHQYGPSNLTGLKNSLPNKTETEIQLLCKEHSKLALKKQTDKRKEAHIRRWLQVLKVLKSAQEGQINDVISRVLKYIALFEKRVDSKNVDVSSCYLALHYMLSGLVPEELSKTTDYFVFECLQKLANCLKYGKMRSFKTYLTTLRNTRDLHKYRNKSKSKIESSLSLNPLGIPDNLLYNTATKTYL